MHAPASTTASTSALSRETSSLPTRHSSPTGASGTVGHVSSSTASASTASAEAELSPTTPSPTHTAHTHAPPHSSSTQTNSGVSEATTGVFSPSALPGATHSLRTTRTTEVSDGSIASASTTSSGVTPSPTSQSCSTVHAPTSTTASTSALSRKTSSLPTRHSSPTGASGTVGHVSSSTASASTASVEAELSPTTPSPTRTAHTHAPPPFTTASSVGTSSPVLQTNSTLTHVTGTTPSTSTLGRSSSIGSTLSSRPIPGDPTNPITSKRTTTFTRTTTTSQNTSKSSSSKTTTGKSTIRSTTGELCYNGGTYDGIKCICNEDLFYGPKCEFPVQECLNGGTYDGIKCICNEDLFYGPKCEFPVQECLNGGTYDGIKCICNEDLFYGPKCEFPVDEIPVKDLSVTIIVETQVRVTNREYNESLEDLSSAYSLEIQDQFRKQMKIIYRAVPGYQGVEILQMRNGSVIVMHKVISQVPVQNNLQMIQKQMENITVSVNNSLKDTHSEGDCSRLSEPELCFVPLPNSILDTTVLYSPEDICKNSSDPRYADYYYPQIIEGSLRCISRCVKGTQGSMNCFNGVCRIFEIGPQCSCNDLDMFWYLDSYCQLRIQKSTVGLSLALAVLFVGSIILTMFLIRAKWKKSRNRWFDDFEIWYRQDTEEEWIPSAGLTIMNEPAVSSWNEHLNQNKTFNPCLNSVDTSVQFFWNDKLGNISSW
ncbi:mucin-3B-like isoform X3 [Python bivittatus]|uniref:Mucin-3B-like isoform X3 n=1 Tax=Python bivittatus TaxID=176946 RepID=A0A9F5JDM8_PYTBI|nr:mucin-3B-like isoform X3 [Python bivittatus]